MIRLPANAVAADTRGLDDLKRAARESPDGALKTAATQFEALFMNMILKNMRDAVPKDGLMSSSAGETYSGMLDQQLSQRLAEKGTGLADMLVRQLGRNVKPAATDAARPDTPVGQQFTRPPVALKPPAPAVAEGLRAPAANVQELKRDFVARMAQHAKEAEHTTGVPARFMIGQAALESGWGKREIRDGSGHTVFNVFGIKATGNWDGPTVDVSTTEFVNGVARKVVAKFRAYASYAEGFADYAKMMANNPRYAGVLKTAGAGMEAFAQGLQRAGYATDPAYATKLTRVINDALRIDRQA